MVIPIIVTLVGIVTDVSLAQFIKVYLSYDRVRVNFDDNDDDDDDTDSSDSIRNRNRC